MLLPFLLLVGKMKNCQLFIFQVRKIVFYGKRAENIRTCNENCYMTLRQDRLCTLGIQRTLLTIKVHLSEADLFIDRICAIIQKQRFVRPDEGRAEQIGKQGVLESWKEKN